MTRIVWRTMPPWRRVPGLARLRRCTHCATRRSRGGRAEPAASSQASSSLDGVVVPALDGSALPEDAVFGTTFLSGVEEYLDNTTPGDAVSWGESRAFVPGVSS